jgi:hypothetical protein|tara:strand:- start:99 stop:386 length:288 start_codon:yes stop_codon:yes gene_type:complete
MDKVITRAEYLKKILKQVQGEPDLEFGLIPEYCVVGSGVIMCYDPAQRTFKRIYRGIKVFVLHDNYDNMGRTLVYTIYGDLVCIEPEELLLTGTD